MTEKNTDLSIRGESVIPDGFIKGEAAGGGNCFFDSVAQGMNELSIPGGPFDVKLLRQTCFNYVDCNHGCIYDTRSNKTWRQAIEEDAVEGMYATNENQEQAHFYIYMAKIGLTAPESSNLDAAIWGRPEIEGCMLCQKYGIKLHVIENFHSSGQEVHRLVDSSGSRSLDVNTSFYNDPQMIHILNEGSRHFVPILRKTLVPNRPIEKQAHISPLEGVYSQDDKTDGLALHSIQSVAASPQEVSLLVAQPEHLEQVPEKIESASEVNTHQAVDGRFVKECSLIDKSTWSAVADKKEDADFKILRITNSPTVSAALDFMQQPEFYKTFNEASHWFVIVIEVPDCSEVTSETSECLAKVLDKEKPVIIQWDLMPSAKHLVFFKQTGQSAFTPLQMDSASLSSAEDERSKKESFQLPQLLHKFQQGTGGHFNEHALDLLNVSFDVKQEIETWRLIDNAAWHNDSLSLRCLLLVDWDLSNQNGEGGRTLEIAAEYGGPQTLSALLNLPTTSSIGEHFLSNEGKELLTLRNDLGDNPLLIAAEKGRPDTLQFLIYCGADILCHRKGDEKVTAIKLAWDGKHYEKVCVLLEADSPFPDEFDIRSVQKCENTAELLKQVEERQSFHHSIKEGSQHVVKAFIKSRPRLKRAYDPSNRSAVMTALKACRYELYALLRSEGLSAGKHEPLSVVLEGLTSEQKCRLKEANLKYFGKKEDSHIINLLSKSRLGLGEENKKDFGIILELYKQLDAIPEISTILKVVEQSEVCEIIFDFSRESIVDLDPTQSSKTRGVCDYRAGRIYVGAKDHSQLLGTLSHELTHLAMQVCYDNDCKPYEALDEQKKLAFDQIVAAYHDKTGIDNIIERVFTVYEKSHWASELIVRVPHLLAHYSAEKDKQVITQQAPELFSFYEQHTLEDLRRFIEDPACIKARNQIQRLNKLMEKMDEIEQSKIWLNEERLLNDDVINCQHIQILSSSLPQLTALNLYQVMRRKLLNISDIKSGFIFVSAEQFKNQEKAESVFEAIQSVIHPTLIIDCSYEYDKSETDLLSTINSFSEKRRIIFIAVTDVAQSLEFKLKEYQAKAIHDKDYMWSDLTPDSQNELLKNTVCFQGSTFSLNKLISVESPVTKFLPLADLLERKTLEIDKPVLTFTSDDCIENYYIARTFNHQVAIKKDIFEKKFSDDLLATTEQEFRKYCQDKQEKNVHWLLADKSGRLIWKQSQGSLRALREYIDTKNPLAYPPENLDKFLQQAQCQKVMLIADPAGMGKTTVLTHLSKQIKLKCQTYWVVKIDFTDHTNVLKAQTEVKKKLQAIEFVSGKLLKLHTHFEKELFKRCCHGLEEAAKVVLMFDGFDEISPNYKKTVLDLLQDLNPVKQPGLEGLWVTTRPHLREILEDNLQQLCYTLQPFSKDNQVGFLTKFWHQHLKLQGGNQQQLKTFARALIEKLAKSISDKENEFTGIPLQMRMLAEAFEEEVETFCLSQKSEPELPKELCLLDLFRKFIETKWNIFKEKGEVAKEQDSKSFMSDISATKNHQKLALETLLPELKDTVLKLEEADILAPEEISRIGIVQYVDDKPHFIHRTFAEYYVADFLVTQLTKETCYLLDILNILFKMLLGPDYGMIRFFVDGLLVNPEKSKVVKQYGEQIYIIWKETLVCTLFNVKNNLTREKLQRVLHMAAEKGSAHIIDFFFTSLKAAGHSNTINELLLHKNSYRQNAWNYAALNGSKEVLEKLWGWGREVQVNLKDDLLLSRDKDGLTAWHRAALECNGEILEKLWGWGREVQVNLKDDMLLSRDKMD